MAYSSEAIAPAVAGPLPMARVEDLPGVPERAYLAGKILASKVGHFLPSS